MESTAFMEFMRWAGTNSLFVIFIFMSIMSIVLPIIVFFLLSSRAILKEMVKTKTGIITSKDEEIKELKKKIFALQQRVVTMQQQVKGGMATSSEAGEAVVQKLDAIYKMISNKIDSMSESKEVKDSLKSELMKLKSQKKSPDNLLELLLNDKVNKTSTSQERQISQKLAAEIDEQDSGRTLQ